MKKKTFTLTIILLILAAGILHIGAIRNGHGWGGDYAWYIAQAKTLLEWEFDTIRVFSEYRQQFSTRIVGPGFYPWGYPALLAPVYALFGDNLYAFKIYNLLFFIGSLLVIVRLFSGNVTSASLLLILALLAINPNFSDFKEQIRSDLPALFFGLLSLLIVQERKTWTATRILLLAAAVFMAYWTRTQYIVLIPSILLFFTWQAFLSKGHRQISILKTAKYTLVLIISLIALYLLDNLLFSKTASYADHLGSRNYLLIFIKNFEYYIKTISHFWGLNKLSFHQFSSNADYYIAIITFPLLALGIRRYWRENQLYLISCCLTLLLLLFFPGRQGIRFVFFILPFYAFFIIKGYGELDNIQRLSPKHQALSKRFYQLLFAFILLIFAANMIHPYAVPAKRSEVIDGPYTATSMEFIEFVRYSTPPDATFAFFKPRILNYLTNRRAVALRRVEDLRGIDVDYLILHKKGKGLGLKHQERAAQLGESVFRNEEAVIYRLYKDP